MRPLYDPTDYCNNFGWNSTLAVVPRVGLLEDLYVQVFVFAPVGGTAPERLTATFEACIPERATGGTGLARAANQALSDTLVQLVAAGSTE